MKQFLNRTSMLATAVTGVALLSAALVGQAATASAQQLDTCGFVIPTSVEVQGLQQAPFCELTVDKSLLTEGSLAVGDHVQFTIHIENTGNFPLDHVLVVDNYDDSALQFVDASIEPSFGPDSGVITWDDLVANGNKGTVWFPEDSLTITLEFVVTASSAENCALASANPFLDNLAVQGGQPFEVVAEEDCVDIKASTSTGNPQGGPRLPTATTEPELPAPTPTPAGTVSPSTAVPSPTRPTGVVAPDTGTGPGGSDGGNVTLILVGLAAATVIFSGAGIVAGKRAR